MRSSSTLTLALALAFLAAPIARAQDKPDAPPTKEKEEKKDDKKDEKKDDDEPGKKKDKKKNDKLPFNPFKDAQKDDWAVYDASVTAMGAKDAALLIDRVKKVTDE